MNAVEGCEVIKTDSFWSFLGPVVYILGALGIIGGIISLLAGRLLLKFVTFIGVIAGMNCIANSVMYILLG